MGCQLGNYNKHCQGDTKFRKSWDFCMDAPYMPPWFDFRKYGRGKIDISLNGYAQASYEQNNLGIPQIIEFENAFWLVDPGGNRFCQETSTGMKVPDALRSTVQMIIGWEIYMYAAEGGTHHFLLTKRLMK